MQYLTCAFTGHRPMSFPFGFHEEHPDCIALKNTLKKQIAIACANGVNTFYTGMALGVDTWAAELVLEKKRAHPFLRLIAVLPYSGQSDRWRSLDVARFQDILSQCDEVRCLRDRYTSTCMQERNRFLVDHADLLIAVYNGSNRSGTAYTLRYAVSQSKAVTIIHTESGRVDRVRPSK